MSHQYRQRLGRPQHRTSKAGWVKARIPGGDGIIALSAQPHRLVPTDILADSCDRRRTSWAPGEHATCLPILTNVSAISKRLVQQPPHIVSISACTFPSHLLSPAMHGDLPPAHSAEPQTQPEVRIDGHGATQYRGDHLWLVGSIFSAMKRTAMGVGLPMTR
ncbi:hypothetical protein C8F01DRAFT_1181963, partial [Mycena amicta]